MPKNGGKRWMVTVLAVIMAGTFAAAEVNANAATPYVFTALGQTYSQDFNDYRGTEGTLPGEMFVTWDDSRTSTPFTGVGDFNDPNSPYGGFAAYTSDNQDFSFGIRERAPVDLRDARLYVEFVNNTGEAITGLEVSYYVEAWFVGDRYNRIRFKYDDQFGSNRFEEDAISTDNPLVGQPGGRYDGKLEANRVFVQEFVDFNTYLDPDGNPFGPLADGQTAYFRWQFSNMLPDESGSLRSGLAIDDINITVVPEPASLLVLGAGLSGLGAMVRRRRK